MTHIDTASKARGLAFSCSCIECGRVFDLLDDLDAQEWTNGHDCEVTQ